MKCTAIIHLWPLNPYLRWEMVIEHTPPLSEVHCHHTPVLTESLPEMGNVIEHTPPLSRVHCHHTPVITESLHFLTSNYAYLLLSLDLCGVNPPNGTLGHYITWTLPGDCIGRCLESLHMYNMPGRVVAGMHVYVAEAL